MKLKTVYFLWVYWGGWQVWGVHDTVEAAKKQAGDYRAHFIQPTQVLEE